MNVSNGNIRSHPVSPNRKAISPSDTVTIEICRRRNSVSPNPSRYNNANIMTPPYTSANSPLKTLSFACTDERKVLSAPGYGVITSMARVIPPPKAQETGLPQKLAGILRYARTYGDGGLDDAGVVNIRRKRISDNYMWDRNGRRYLKVDPNSITNMKGSGTAGDNTNDRNGEQRSERIGRENSEDYDERIDLPVYKGREHYALIQQVKNCLQEANEPPPVTVNEEEVEERRKILSKLLEKLEHEWHQTSIRNQELKLARRNRALDKEEKRKTDINIAEKKKEFQFMLTRASYNEERDERHQKRNQRILEKAYKCKELQEKIMCNRIKSLEELNKVREVKLQKIEHDRERAVEQLRERKKAQQRMALEVRMRNEKEEADLVEYQRQRMEVTRKYREEREAEMRALKEEEIRRMSLKRNKRKAQGPGTKTIVIMKGAKGPPELITCEMTHEDRLKASEMADAEQRRRYMEMEEFRHEYKEAMKMKRKMKEDKMRDNNDRILEDRLRKYEKILQKEKDKSQYVMQMRQEVHACYEKEAECLNMDLKYHQKRSREILEKKCDNVAKKKFIRWNQRGSLAMMSIIEKYGAIKVKERFHVTDGDRTDEGSYCSHISYVSSPQHNSPTEQRPVGGA
eukprot:Tbor_TRINITY_DN4490_c0_g1::TRINITY_DN4490_c0_g1_i1::g.8022::m.8022